MRFKGFIGPSYKLRSVNADCQRCVNQYPEINELQTEKENEVGSLVGCEGFEYSVEMHWGALPIRCLYQASDGKLFAVNGNNLYKDEITSDPIFSDVTGPVSVSIQTLGSYNSVVYANDNGIDAVFVDGTSSIYVYTLATGITSIVSMGFNTNSVCFLDGYFIFNDTDSGKFYFTSDYGTTIDPLDFASAESNPDKLVKMLVLNNRLWLLGSNSTEVWQNTDNADNPFERIPNAILHVGCIAPDSACILSTTIAWLGGDTHGGGSVWIADGFSPKRISTHALEQEIASYSSISDAYAFSYYNAGHFFYVLTFPSDEKTWVYDLTIGQWHERMTLVNGEEKRYRAYCHMCAGGVHYIGDYQYGRIYKLNNSKNNFIYWPRKCIRSSPHSSGGMKRIIYDSFQLDMEAGVGANDAPGYAIGAVTYAPGDVSDPQVMFRYSDDGGKSWSSTKYSSIGKIGERKKRIIFRRLGWARDRVFEVSISDSVSVTLLGAEINARPCNG